MAAVADAVQWWEDLKGYVQQRGIARGSYCRYDAMVGGPERIYTAARNCLGQTLGSW